MTSMQALQPAHFEWQWHDRVATIRLHGPDRKNPLPSESYAELRDCFRNLAYAEDVDAISKCFTLTKFAISIML